MTAAEMIAHEVRLLRIAVQFLTRVPVGDIEGFEAAQIERAAKYFPLVGALAGCIAAITLLTTSAVLPQPLPMLLGLAAALLITGALHEDGLADTADGLCGGATRERRLEIMKDSRVGTFGILALIVTLALKAAALMALDPVMAALVLIAANAGGRLAAVVAMSALPYVGDAAAAKIGPLTTGVSPTELAVAIAFGMIAGLAVLAPATFLISLAVGLAAAAAAAIVSRRRIGGITGDVLGAIEQVFETAFMIGAAAVIAGPG